MKRISSYGPVLKSELRVFLKSKKLTRPGRVGHWNNDLLERLEPFATSGKLLRGSTLCFAYEAFGDDSKSCPRPVLDAAMALEIVHSALLIHDDIMDGDELRRGHPSFHRQYRDLSGSHTDDADRLGVNMALAAGDAAIFLGMELLMRSLKEHGDETGAYSLFIDQMLSTSAGQMQDVYMERAGDKPSKKVIYELMETKTAAYTLALPLAMGAALAGQPPSELKLLKAIGTAGGTIFQIRDDELGVMGNPELTGKPIGSDIKEGKITLLYYYLIKTCTPSERRRLKMIFGNRSIDRDDIEYVRDLVKRNKLHKSLGKEVDQLREKAYAGIDKLALGTQHKNEIKQLIDFCARRQL